MADKIPINMKLVDDLLTAGCNGIEVAAHLGCHPDTLYNRIQAQHGETFTAYSAKKRAKGESLLRAQQFAKALGISKNGDNMMLIWLGKNRLNQSDNPGTDKPVNDDKIADNIELAKAKAELSILREQVNVSNAGKELIPSNEAPEHMVRGCEVGENL